MSGLMSVIFFIIGIAWAIMGKDVMAVLACFIIYAILSGAYEIRQLREYLEGLGPDEPYDILEKRFKEEYKDGKET